MKKLFASLLLLLCLAPCLMLNGCTQMRLKKQVRESRTVVLDIGHYAGKNGEGNGARTPDNRYGFMEESQFWYTYAIYTKQVIEAAGYTCIITNRGSEPYDKTLAEHGKKAGVVQINSPIPGGVYRSTHHPSRLAVGMLSVNYALDQKPACVVFLHHNSNSSKWQKTTTSAFYTNDVGQHLALNMADVINKKILNHGMPNSGTPCGIIIRTDGRKGGGDWLNACNESYVPAAITEVAYLNNPEHVQYLSQTDNAIKFAQSIGEGIVQHLNTR